ncbi:MAG: M42 family metallopeptidase [Thermodesulfobacteriota bacterium]
MELVKLLSDFCAPLGPPGREDEARQVVREVVEPLAHRVEVDRLGNLRAWLNPERRPLVMLDAHLDEVGLVVQHVDDQGFLRVAALGGLDARLLPGSRVTLQPRPGVHLPAVVGLLPPHVEKPADKDKALPWEALYLDAGLESAAAAAAVGVEVGTPGVLEAGQGPLGAGCFYARNLDDRAGCAVLAAVFMELARVGAPDCGLVFNFAVAEEVGLRGAATAAFDLAPDLALAVDCTVGDTPGLDEARRPSRLGGGPAITVSDGRIVVPWRLVESLEGAASAAGVACQRKKPPYGGTDAGAIHTSRGGVPTAVVAVPARYIHSPVSLLKLTDLEATAALVKAWLVRAPELA